MSTPVKIPCHDKYVRNRGMCQRYDSSSSTITRWVKKGKLPAPEYFNGQRFWRIDKLEESDKKNIRGNK